MELLLKIRRALPLREFTGHQATCVTDDMQHTRTQHMQELQMQSAYMHDGQQQHRHTPTGNQGLAIHLATFLSLLYYDCLCENLCVLH